MVKKANNNELDNFLDENELNQVNKNNNNNNKNHKNKKRNNQNKKHNNNNNNNKNHKHNNQKQQRNNSSIPTRRPKRDFEPDEPSQLDQFEQDQQDDNNTGEMTLAQFEENYQKQHEQKQKAQKEIEEIDSIQDEEKSDLLKNLNVDLNDIEIISDIDYDVNKENTNFVLNSKATHQVVMAQSAYIAHMEALTNQNVLSIGESIDDNYNSVLRRYQLYFDKINTNSLGIKNFADFARLTSVYDVSTLEYGIYNISFPGTTTFDIKCGNCKKNLKNVKISNDQLMSFKDEDAYRHVTKNVQNITTTEQNKKHSLVNKVERFMLDQSKIIIDMAIPSIEKHLTVLGNIHTDGMSEEESKKFRDNSTSLMHIKNVYVPDLVSLSKGQKPKFQKIPEDNLREIMRVVENLPIRDGHKLADKIFDMVGKHAIEYVIQGATCPNCGEDLGRIDLDMTELLFREALHLG